MTSWRAPMLFDGGSTKIRILVAAATAGKPATRPNFWPIAAPIVISIAALTTSMAGVYYQFIYRSIEASVRISSFKLSLARPGSTHEPQCSLELVVVNSGNKPIVLLSAALEQGVSQVGQHGARVYKSHVHESSDSVAHVLKGGEVESQTIYFPSCSYSSIVDSLKADFYDEIALRLLVMDDKGVLHESVIHLADAEILDEGQLSVNIFSGGYFNILRSDSSLYEGSIEGAHRLRIGRVEHGWSIHDEDTRSTRIAPSVSR